MIICKECGREYLRYPEFIRHLNKEFECLKEYIKKYKYKELFPETIQNNIDKQKGQIFEYYCEFCRRGFINVKAISKHIQTKESICRKLYFEKYSKGFENLPWNKAFQKKCKTEGCDKILDIRYAKTGYCHHCATKRVIKDRSRNAKLTTTQTEFIKDGKVDWRCEFCSISFVSKTLLNNHAKDSECSKLFYDKYRIQGLFPWNNYNKKHSNCVDCRKIIVFGGTRCKKCSTKEVANREEIRKNSSESKKGDKHWLRQPGAIHPNKDKTYIEIHGEEKSQLLKNDLSDLGKLLVGNKNPFFGKTHTEEVRKIFSENKLGKTYIEMYGEEKTKKINKKKEETWLKTIGETSPFKTTKYRENMKEFMLNGGAAHALSFVRNPSKPQIELFNLISEVCPYPIMNYPCLNKSIDIAIPKLSIAVEYDGSYFHQDKEADDIRQKLLESEGWKFLRYLDYIPSKDELLKDIIELLDK